MTSSASGWTESDLINVEDAIRARLTGGAVNRYSVAGRSLEYITLQELRDLRDEIRRSLNASNGLTIGYARHKRSR